MTVDEAIQKLANEAERLGAECNDDAGLIRKLVAEQGLGFNAWFCVCCELADRDARRLGYKNAVEFAFKQAELGASLKKGVANVAK